MDVNQALTKAVATGTDVPVPTSTTATSTLTANSDGTLTVKQSLLPVRRRVNGTWQNLDSTLVKNADGSISPAVSASDLTLSSGGDGSLATMTADGHTLSVTFPISLPAPTISGDTATYPDVLDGVDLQVTATDQGSFSEVLVVKNSTGAANPELDTLTLATQTNDLNLSADSAGNITAADRHGAPIFTSAAPLMWDSTTAGSQAAAEGSGAKGSSANTQRFAARNSPAVHAGKMQALIDPDTDQPVDPQSGLPIDSSADGPGEDAQVATLAADVTPDHDITLTPDPSLLTGQNTVYPVYIDPKFNGPSANDAVQAWTQVNSYYDSASYWKSSDPLRVGYQDWDSPTFVARSYVRIGVPSVLDGSTVASSELDFSEEWSPSCTPESVDLATSTSISSSTTWDNKPGTGTVIQSHSVADGYDSSCPAGNVGFDITTQMSNAAGPGTGHASSLTFQLRAADETDKYGWKEFTDNITSETTYNHKPNTPTQSQMSTSPTTPCTGGIVGDGPVALDAVISDPDSGSVGASYLVTNDATGGTIASSDPQSLYTGSGGTATLNISKATLDAAANNSEITIDWKVQVSDFSVTSNWSPTCSFTFDPTRPGAPQITLPGASAPGCDTSGNSQNGTVGQRETFSVSPPSGSSPTSYVYQLNDGAPATLAGGSGQISVTPNRPVNVLSVTGLSPGSNYGSTSTCVFNSAPPAQDAADQDLDGSGAPDLLMTGSQNNLPAGLWLAGAQSGPGAKGDGHIDPTTTDIGLHGSGVNEQTGSGTDYGTPADFNGAIASSGRFTGTAFQDVLVYYPSGTHAGNGFILNGTGDGSALTPAGDTDISSGMLTVFPDGATPDLPTQLANAGYAFGETTGPTDLIGTAGDSTNGYSLYLYQATGPGAYNGIGLDINTPTNGSDWNSWTISTAQMPATSSTPGTAMYLWNQSTGDLYLWTSLSYDENSGMLTHTSQKIASGFHTQTSETLQAADINGDGSPDLWTTNSSGTVTANLLNPTTNTFASGSPTDTLSPISHLWDLDDNDSGAVTTAADQGGTLPLSASGNTTGDPNAAAFTTGQLFDPDLTLNPNGEHGYLKTSGPALNLSSDFTVSLWAKPNAYGGVALSQDGTNVAGVSIYPNATDDAWYVCLGTSDSSTATVTGSTNDCSHGGSASLGAWSNITLTYNHTTQNMELYVNGVPLGTTTHVPVSSSLFRGNLNLGSALSAGTRTDYFNGSLSQVRTWNTALTPTEVAYDAPSDGPIVFPSDNTQYPSGSHWSLGATTLSFTQGTLTVTSAGTTTYASTFNSGMSGTSAAVLTLQSDGNLVAYANAAAATAKTTSQILWSSGTSGTGDVLFLQPTGNVVIHANDGLRLWATNTSFLAPGCDRWPLSQATAGLDDADTNIATPTGGVTYGTDHNTTALAATVFDGSTGIDRADGPGVVSTSSFTVSAWVNLTHTGTNQTAVGQGTINHQAFYLGYSAANGWVFQMTTTDDATTTYPTAYDSTVTTGTWTHLVGVYNASTSTLSLYVTTQGATMSTTPVDTSTDTTPQYNPAGALTVGALETAGSTTPYQAFGGSISDVRTYTGALTGAEISSM